LDTEIVCSFKIHNISSETLHICFFLNGITELQSCIFEPSSLDLEPSKSHKVAFTFKFLSSINLAEHSVKICCSVNKSDNDEAEEWSELL